MKKNYLIHSLFLSFSVLMLSVVISPVCAQEMIGAAISNYSGQSGIDLNPASIVSAPYKWEFHVLSVDADVQNNYIYIKAKSKLVHNSFAGETTPQNQFPDNGNQSKEKFAYASAFAKYPGFIWVGKKFSVAFNVSTRLELSANHLPYHLVKFSQEGFSYNQLQQLDLHAKNTSIDLLNWHEFGLTLGAVINSDPQNYLTAAITPKYNMGLNALYIDIQNMDYNSKADTLLQIYNINANYGHALPDVNDGAAGALQQKGKGWSASGGIEYYRNRNETYYNPCIKHDEKPYDYKLGISFMDFGYINYSTNASAYTLNNAQTSWYGIDTTKFKNMTHADSLFSQQFLGAAGLSKSANNFTIYTPAAISTQLDVPINTMFYLNFACIQRVSFGPRTIKRSNILAFTPRFETRGIELSVPVSMYEFYKTRVGAELRFHCLTVGSDMLGPLLGITNSYGADIYFAIKIQHFTSCERNSRRHKLPRVEKCNTPK